MGHPTIARTRYARVQTEALGARVVIITRTCAYADQPQWNWSDVFWACLFIHVRYENCPLPGVLCGPGERGAGHRGAKRSGCRCLRNEPHARPAGIAWGMPNGRHPGKLIKGRWEKWARR